MYDEILCAMSNDMHIIRYENETDTEFACRILYSGLSCWIKTSSADAFVGTSVLDLNNGISQKHITEKCTTILNEFLKRYPETKTYFSDEQYNPVNIIEHRLIHSGDLLKVGFNTNLVLSTQKEEQITNNLKWVKGVILNKNCIYSGISTIKYFNENNFSCNKIENSVNWLDNYLKNIKWNEADNNDDALEYFNPYKKSYNNMNCWQNEIPKPVGNLWYARKQLLNHDYEFYLIKKTSGQKLTHTIEEFLCKTKERTRIMFALRTKANNSNTAKAIIYKDHVTLNMRFHLPNKEISLLENFAWPCNRFSNVLDWNLPNEIYNYVKGYLTELGIKIWEENYNG